MSSSTVDVTAPVTLTRSTKTKVKLQDGAIMVISGLLKDDSEKYNSAVPGLSRIPILGWLFKTKSGSYEKTNMMVFISTHIIRTAEDAKKITDKKTERICRFQKGDRYKDNERIQMIEFDKLIAMYLKYPDRGDFVPVSDGDSVSMLYYGQVGLSKARHLAFSMQISDVAYVASERQTILSELEMLESNRDDEYSDDLEDFEDTADILSASHDDAPIIKLVNQTIIQATKSGASDIHFEGLTGKFAVRFRIDGKLTTIRQYPKSLQESVVARLKVISDLDVAETRKAQDGRINLKIGNRDVDIRVSTIPSVTGRRLFSGYWKNLKALSLWRKQDFHPICCLISERV